MLQNQQQPASRSGWPDPRVPPSRTGPRLAAGQTTPSARARCRIGGGAG